MKLLVQPMCNMRNKIFQILVALVLLFGTSTVNGQEVYDLTRCILTGLERNYALQIVRNREEISSNNFSPGNAGQLPTVSLTNRMGGTMNSSVQNPREGEQVVNNGVHNTSGSMAATLGMNLFRGFQVKTTYEKLGELKQMGELNTQMSVENLISRIVSEYNYYIQQLTLYHNLAYAVSLSRERVRIDEQRYLLGSSSKLQLLQALVYLNADSSRYARQTEVLNASQIRLNELMASDDLSEAIIIQDTVISIDETLVYEQLYASTVLNNTGLQIAAKNRYITELDYKIIASRAYPYLNFTTGYSYNYSGFESGSMRNQQVRGMNYGLTLGIDLFDGLNRRRERANAIIDQSNQQYAYQQIEMEITGDLLTIFYAYQNNLRLLKMEEQNLEVARENLEIALERYKLGSLSGIELREVQKSLLDAEERLISVKYQTKLAEISLMQISGRILEYV